MTPVLAQTPVLTTDHLTLRAPAARDWPAFRAMMASDAKTPGDMPCLVFRHPKPEVAA